MRGKNRKRKMPGRDSAVLRKAQEGNGAAFQKDMELEILIEDMDVEGQGIGKAEGIIFFVKDAVIGDRALVKVMKMKKTYGYARLLKILEPSPYRVEPLCPYARQCGGCQLQALDYSQQLKYKENKVRNNLKRIGGFAWGEIAWNPIIGMDTPYFYRNKAQFPVGRDKEGRIAVGFYAARSHQIIPNRKCFLGMEMDVTEQVLDSVVSYMEENNIPAYDEVSGTGLVRHLLIRYGYHTKEVMACLVINGRQLPHEGRLLGKLRAIRGMAGVVLNVNEEDTNVILGQESRCIWGKGYITDSIGDVEYQISSLSFYQVNPVQTEKLYQKVLEYAGLTGQEVVWDLYCGIGTISLFLAQKAKWVYGVESVAPAVEDARKNAHRNGIGNVEFFVGKAEEVLPGFYEKGAEEGNQDRKIGQAEGQDQGKDNKVGQGQAAGAGMLHPDVIVVDPPRKGCDRKCLETIIKMEPERVVYVSCDSATLARDLKYLCENGYEVKEGQVLDMFPNTVHVETIVLIQKKNS
jgi:23S rRNA (uracil1939-C5)-methyltransferase